MSGIAGGRSLGMEGERLVGEVRLREKRARLGHDEEFDILAESLGRVSICCLSLRYPDYTSGLSRETPPPLTVPSFPRTWLPSLDNGETGPIHSLRHSGNLP